MDWAKSKNILIVAFIITNIFLIYNIQGGIYKVDETVAIDDKIVKDTKNILKEKDIIVEAQVPKTVIEMAPIDVEYERYDKKDIQKLVKSNDWNISVENEKLLRLRTEALSDNYFMAREDAYRIAENFIKKLEFNNSGETLWNIVEYNNRYEVIFKQTYKAKFLENSYMKVLVSTNGVEEFERIWLKPIIKDRNKREIMPATKALLKVIDKLEGESKPVQIREISLGYWFDPSQISYINSENTTSGTAFPAWRIVTSNNTVKFVSAYDKY